MLLPDFDARTGAEGAMIKIGIPMGPFTWSPVNSTDYRTRNGRVVNNKFLSTGNGYFGYAMCALSTFPA